MKGRLLILSFTFVYSSFVQMLNLLLNELINSRLIFLSGARETAFSKRVSEENKLNLEILNARSIGMNGALLMGKQTRTRINYILFGEYFIE